MISSIEGIGGEVIQFFLGLGVIFICFILWLSTRVRNAEEPFFRTVYVLERRVGRNNDGEQNSHVHVMEHSREGTRTETLPDHGGNQPILTIQETTSNESVVNSQDDATPVDVSKSESETNRCMSSNTDGSQSSSTTQEVESNSQESREKVTSQTEPNIKVRLKYTNDDSREVHGFLQERLLDFKKRNFPEEIGANKLIRLIFNGRLLRDDNVSLQSYGLFDDCVVHCLIINERPPQPANTDQQEHTQSSFSLNNDQATAPEWNLSKMLCFIVVGILSLTWYCRFQFAALFTFTSTTFLFALTIIFVCSILI